MANKKMSAFTSDATPSLTDTISTVTGSDNAQVLLSDLLTLLFNNVPNSSIDSDALVDESVESIKLAENFLRSRYQANTTNSAETGQTIQHGWGFIQGNNSSNIQETVTFPTEFATESPVIQITFYGARAVSGGAPTSTDDFTNGFGNFEGMAAQEINTTDFVARMYADSNYSSSFYYGYGWLAIGKL